MRTLGTQVRYRLGLPYSNHELAEILETSSRFLEVLAKADPVEKEYIIKEAHRFNRGEFNGFRDFFDSVFNMPSGLAFRPKTNTLPFKSAGSEQSVSAAMQEKLPETNRSKPKISESGCLGGCLLTLFGPRKKTNEKNAANVETAQLNVSAPQKSM